MENQHRQISGYRELSQAEIDLMNEAKALEKQVLVLHEKILTNLRDIISAIPIGSAEAVRLHKALPFSWLDSGRINVQTGFMQLIRAIAQPQ